MRDTSKKVALTDGEKDFVCKSLHEDEPGMDLLKETSCSILWRIEAQNEYVLKISKRESLREEYDNHKVIYDIWRHWNGACDFIIPQVHAIRDDGRAYIMDCIEDGRNLLELLLCGDDANDTYFCRAGQCLHQYHEMATRQLGDKSVSLCSHNTVSELLSGSKKKDVLQILSHYETSPQGIIFKDYKPTNVVVDGNGSLYLCDFQKIYYGAPYSYDLARFIDTTRVFVFKHKPVMALLRKNVVSSAVESFIRGYDCGLDLASLHEMRRLHRAEHIQMKKRQGLLSYWTIWLVYHVLGL